MYTLIIVDDEELIRNGLNKFINWEALGIQVVKLFEDGKETIDYLSKNHVDIVLTDIAMVEKSGLDIAKYIYDHKLPIKTVLISGHREFEYAQKGIQYKIENYILKPTNFKNVHDVFKSIVDKLDKEREQEKSSSIDLPVLPGYRDYNFSDEELAIYKNSVDLFEEFFKKINSGDTQAIVELNQVLFATLNGATMHFIHAIVIDLFSNLVYKFNQLHLHIAELSEGRINSSNIMEITDHGELEIYCKELFLDLTENMKKSKDDSSEKVISQALTYIHENYAIDLALDDVASRVGLNPVYFCRYFKMKTGKTFVDYLTHIRMEHAVKLLQEGEFKIYEISEQVGYKSSKYFARVFKKHTGLLPSEYYHICGNT